jgi:hypothetical protein
MRVVEKFNGSEDGSPDGKRWSSTLFGRKMIINSSRREEQQSRADGNAM